LVLASACSKAKPVPVLTARLVVPVRNVESTATCPGRFTDDLRPTEAPLVLPARLELPMPRAGNLTVSAEGTVLESRPVDAGVAVILVAPQQRPGTRRIAIDLSGDPAVHHEYELSTVVVDGSSMPIGHTLLNDVDVATGRVSVSRDDLEAPEFVRSFRTNALASPSLGDGWMHNHELFVIEDGNPAAPTGVRRYLVVSPGGGQVFTCTEGGCRAQRGYHGTFREEPPFVVFRAKAGQDFRFAPVPSGFPTRYYRLEDTVTPLNEHTVFSYEHPLDPTRLTQVTDPAGITLRFFYDGPLLVRVEVGGGEVARCIEYRHTGTELVGVTRLRGPCSDGGTPESAEAYAYSNGRLTTTPGDDDGGVLTYVYLDDGDHLDQEECYGLAAPLNQRVHTAVSGDHTTRYQYSWVPEWRTVLGVRLAAWKTRVTDEEPGLAPLHTTYWLDGFGAMVQRESKTSGRQPRLLSQLWDPVHLVLTDRQEDAAERERFSFDDFGNLVMRRKSPSRTHRRVDAGAPTVERWAYDPGFGAVTCHVDTDGRVTFFGVDSNEADPRDAGVTGTGLTISRVRYVNRYKPAATASCVDALEEVQRSADDEVTLYRYCGVDGVRCKAGGAYGTFVGKETHRREELEP
jgi:hypothetical protein